MRVKGRAGYVCVEVGEGVEGRESRECDLGVARQSEDITRHVSTVLKRREGGGRVWYGKGSVC